MKSSAIWVGTPVAILLIIVIVILVWVPFCPKRTELYVADQCKPFSATDDAEIEVLVVETDDVVQFQNKRDTAITLAMPPGWFNMDEAYLLPGQYAIFEVIRTGDELAGYSISGQGCPGGTPKVKIGDPP